jgi:hypothetical protein
MQVKKNKNFSRPKRKPSLVFNEKSSYKESDSQKAFKEQLDLKTIPALRKQNLRKDKLGFTKSFNYSIKG